jgi:hypothetical protein
LGVPRLAPSGRRRLPPITQAWRSFLYSDQLTVALVNGIFENLAVLRAEERPRTGRDPRGRLPRTKRTCSESRSRSPAPGLDATLKELVKEATDSSPTVSPKRLSTL